MQTHGCGDESTNITGIRMFSGYFVTIRSFAKISFDTGEEKIGTYQFLIQLERLYVGMSFLILQLHMSINNLICLGQGGSEQDACNNGLMIQIESLYLIWMVLIIVPKIQDMKPVLAIRNSVVQWN